MKMEQKLVKCFAPICEWTYENPPARGLEMRKWHWGPLPPKMSKLSIKIRTGYQYVGYLYYSETKMGRTKLSIGLHAVRGLGVGHSCFWRKKHHIQFLWDSQVGSIL